MYLSTQYPDLRSRYLYRKSRESRRRFGKAGNPAADLVQGHSTRGEYDEVRRVNDPAAISGIALRIADPPDAGRLPEQSRGVRPEAAITTIDRWARISIISWLRLVNQPGDASGHRQSQQDESPCARRGSRVIVRYQTTGLSSDRPSPGRKQMGRGRSTDVRSTHHAQLLSTLGCLRSSKDRRS